MTEAGVSIGAFRAYLLSVSMLIPIMGLTLATVLIWRQPFDRMPLSTALFFGTCTINVTAVPEIVADHYSALALPLRLFVISGYGFLPLFATFPDGRFVPRWARWLALAQCALALSDWVLPSLYAEGTAIARLSAIWSLSYGLATLGFQVYRYREVADTQQRQQIKWVVSGVLLLVLYALAMAFVPSTWHTRWISPAVTATVGTFLIILLILAFWIALLRYRLFDIDLILNRMLVYGTLTGLVGGVYAVVVGGLGIVVGASGRTLLPIIAAALIAILFNPLRERVQRGVNRLLFGQRNEPYTVITDLSRRLEVTPAHDTVLTTIVQTIGQALKLPYVAIVPSDASIPQAEYLQAVQRSNPRLSTWLRLPLTYQHQSVGTLILAPRAGEARFSAADRTLLTDLARLTSITVHAARITSDLQRSRERIIAAREEERRRLRRDLHGGLGPQLASQTLTLDVVAKLLHTNSDQAEALLRDVRDQTQQAVTEIRELIDGLRPPALDDMGLAGAIQELADRLTRADGSLRVMVQTPDDLPELPAAVEVAAYRIAAGASGYILKGANGEETLRAIRAAAHGEAIFSPTIAQRIMQYFDMPPSAVAFPDLTDREREILKLMAQGLTNNAIAEHLSLSIKTVRNRVSDIFSKLHVSDRAKAISKARNAGLS